MKIPKRNQKDEELKYDVAFSFAGERREYVGKVAAELRKSGIEVFYDEYNQTDSWGRNLVDHFHDIYGKKASFVVVFISEEYPLKTWTNYEREVITARSLVEKGFLLPARFDDTDVKGLPNSIGYMDLKKFSSEEFAHEIIKKLGKEKNNKIKGSEADFPLPNAGKNKINPYEERKKFFNYVMQELKRRCGSVPAVDFYEEENGDKKQIRILYEKDLVFSLDIQKGGVGFSSDQGVSFSVGDRGSVPSGVNGYGDFEWDKEKNEVVLNMTDFSVFGFYGDGEKKMTFGEFLDKIWERIVKNIEEYDSK